MTIYMSWLGVLE